MRGDELIVKEVTMANTLIKIAKGRDCGRPISGQAARSYARVALKKAGITWGSFQPKLSDREN